MNRLINYSLVNIIAFGIVACSFKSNGTSESHSPGDKVNTNVSAPAATPPLWPWRGVSVEGRKTRPADIAYLASVHVNCVRIMIKPPKRAAWDKIDPVRSFYLELAWADSLMDACKASHITSVFCFDNVVLDPKLNIDDKSPEFWNESIYRDSVYKMVDIIVKRNASRGDELSAYEFIGEPAVKGSFGNESQVPEQLEDYYKRVLQEIRKYDAKRFFYLSPGPWGKPNNFQGFEGFHIKDPYLLYGAHMYLPDPYTHQGVKGRDRGFTYPGDIKNTHWDKAMIRKSFASVKEFQEKTHALIYIGEFQAIRYAPGADQWVQDVADVIEENGWSWTMYAFQCDQQIWDPYFICSNPTASPNDWNLTYLGKESPNWQLFLRYFKKNNP